MGTAYIDLASLGPTEDTARLRAELLNLNGLLLPRQHRDTALRSLSSGNSIICQPGAFSFWRRLPSTTPIVYAEDVHTEDSPALRLTSWLLWSLVQLGLTPNDARILERKPPKVHTHKHWELYHTAEQMAHTYERMADVTLPPLDVLGDAPDVRVDSPALPYTWDLVPTRRMVRRVWKLLDGYAGTVGIDVETSVVGSEPSGTADKLVGIGLSFSGTCFYGEASNPYWMDMLRACLPSIRWIAWNAIYDLAVLRRYGINPGILTGDGMLAARLLGEPTAGLKDVVLRHYGTRMITYDDVTHGGKRSIRDVPPEEVAEYCSGDCYWAVRATDDLVERLTGQALKLYRETDLPLVSTLVDMELYGMLLDVDSATKSLSDVNDKLLALREGIDTVARDSGYVRPDTRRVCPVCRNGKNKKVDCERCKGEGSFYFSNPVNPGSPKQLVEWLHGHLGLTIRGLSRRTGEPSVDARALLHMQNDHPAVPLLLNWRTLDRYREFLEGWLEDAQGDGRIHTDLTIAFTASGRLSSRNPNLQQVSRPWRKHFVAPDGSVLACADYVQLEVRIAAFASRDPVLMAAMNADPNTEAGDLHSQNVYKLFGVPYEDQKDRPDLRVRAKNFLFGALYGSRGQEVQAVLEKAILADPSLGIPPTVREISRGVSEIHNIYSHYFREWVPFMVDRAREQSNTAYTCFGRPRVIPDLSSIYKEQREAAERMAISMIVQGTAADIARMACNLVNGLAGGRLLLQVHDELIAEVPINIEGGLDKFEDSVVECMCLGQPLAGVPLVVSIGSGRSWLEAK